MSFKDTIKQQQNTIEYNESNNFYGVAVENPANKKLLTALVLDTSSSMDSKMQDLATCFNGFVDTIRRDDSLNLSVELSAITFGSTAQVKIPFSSVQNIKNLSLQANGSTAMYEALLLAIAEVNKRKNEHKAIGVDYSRPLIFLVTDGSPTDMSLNCSKFNQLQWQLLNDEKIGSYSLFPIGVDGCDYKFLNALSPNPALELANADFKKLFLWLQNSMELIINGNNNNEKEIILPDPTQGKFAWGKFKL